MGISHSAMDKKPTTKKHLQMYNVNENLSNEIVSFADITSAAFYIQSHIIRTPVNKCNLENPYGMEIYFKKDFLQVTGSFKERGACYALMTLSKEQKQVGVVTASLGNHAQALAYHAGRQKIPCTVVMPVYAPIVKVEACRRFGAHAVIYGQNMAEAKTYAHEYGTQRNLTYINGYDDPAIIAGQGTIGLELLEDLPNIEVVVIPVGGGGLIAGVALAIKTLRDDIKIIGVETDRCPSFSSAMESGKPVWVSSENTLADGLAVNQVGDNPFKIAAPLIDKMIVVKEEWIPLAMLRLLENEKCVVEGAGAAGFAAVLSGQLSEYAGKKVAILLCGGNIDSSILGRCIERSLAADGRLLKFSIIISDRPGGVSEICKLLADVGASIKQIDHDRAWLTAQVFHVVVTIVCETRDNAHVDEIKKVITEQYGEEQCVFIEHPKHKL